MTVHINFLLLGLGNGAVFAALALCLVVTYRSSGVLNFATGAIALYGAYTYAFLRNGQLLDPIPGLPQTVNLGGPLGFWPALAITLVIQALLGALLYVCIFRFLRNAVPVAKAVASLGLMLALTGLLAQRGGSTEVLVGQIFPRQRIAIGNVSILGDRLWFAVTIVGVALVLAALYRFTRFGLSTRAAAETEVGALVSGVSPERVAVVNWAIGAMVAGLAGVLIAPLTPLVPLTYTLFIVPALAAAVLGQFTMIMPAVAGGLVIGMLQSEAVFLRSQHSWFPQNGSAELIPLILVLLVLVVRGRPLPSRGTLIQQTLGRAPRPHGLLLPAVAGTVVLLVALFATSGSYRGGLIFSLIIGIVALSSVVVTGYAGQVSLAQLTLAGVAGFLLSPLTTSWGIPFPIAPVIAALGATLIGVVVGLPALRIRGLLVAIVTLTLATALEAVWFRNNSFNGGSGGDPVVSPRLFGIDLRIGTGDAYPRIAFGVLCIVVLVGVALCVARLRTSRLGSAMLAVRANERSAAASGISVVKVKLIAFAIGAFIAGIGGSLLAYSQGSVTWDSYSAFAGLVLFSTVYLVGITSVAGGVLAGVLASGGILFVAVNRVVNVDNWFGVVTGLLLVFTVIRNPEGLVGPMHVALERRRNRVDTGHAGAIATEVAAPIERPSGAHLAPTLLAVDDLRVQYGGVVAVDGVSLVVPEGAIVGLIGPNGAGKTTMMDALGGFARYSGSVSLDGDALDGLTPHRRAHRGLGRTFQGIDLYEDLSVGENVIVGEYISGVRRSHASPSEADASQVDTVLAQLGLLAVKERSVAELSQGQRQLVSVARALVGRPRLLLLDEPAAGLDTTESEWLAQRLRAVRDGGVTILLIDHDMSLVLALCDLIYVLDFGALIASGTPDVIRGHEEVANAYLGETHAASMPS